MKTSEDGLKLIEKFEGCCLKAYRCPANVLTIGYGHTSAAGAPEVTEGLVITKDQAMEILRRDIAAFERELNSMLTCKVTQHQYDALMSFMYNVGVGALRKSTLLKRVNAGQFDMVRAEFMKWTRGGGRELPGLVARRRAEADLFIKHDEVADSEEYRLTPDRPQPTKTMVQSKEGNAAIATGAMGGLGLVSQVADQAKQASDSMDVIMSLVKSPNFLAMVAIVALGAGIWFWRKQRLNEEAS